MPTYYDIPFINVIVGSKYMPVDEQSMNITVGTVVRKKVLTNMSFV